MFDFGNIYIIFDFQIEKSAIDSHSTTPYCNSYIEFSFIQWDKYRTQCHFFLAAYNSLSMLLIWGQRNSFLNYVSVVVHKMK